MGNKQGSLANHLETASKTGALAFPGKVRIGNASVKIPTHYFKKKCLQKLEEFPEELQKVSKNLRNLDLSDNKIASVPRWIANFKALKTLNIKMNRLTQLPEEIGQLVKLETLVICGNLLNALPKSLSKLRSLREFDASHNQISTFPVTLSSLNNLDSVDLSSNKIKSIPDGVEELQLTILSLNQVRIEREHYFPREPSKIKSWKFFEKIANLSRFFFPCVTF